MSDQDRHELKIAGLLHDCGKITTPVHVVDKATKLQTLFDRIELIDTRFEIVKRDVELELCGRELAAARATARPVLPHRDRSAQARLAADRRRSRVSAPLQRRRRIMRPEDQERVRQISARYRWRDAAATTPPC